jgi:hypothetical protein
MKKIDSLTPEQEALMEVVRNEWIAVGLSTLPIDRKKAEDAIDLAYKCANQKLAKQKVWVRSPMAGAILVSLLGQPEGKKDTNLDFNTLPEKLREDITAACKEIEIDLRDVSFSEISSALTKCCYGQHDVGWLSFYSFFRRIGLEGIEQIDGLLETAKECSWWWPYTDLVICSERPTFIASFDDGNRLHSELGKAITFGDDWGVAIWHGVRIPFWVITNPERITKKTVTAETNQEVRRAMIERVGWAKYLEEFDYKEIQKDEFGILLECEMGDDENKPGRFVKVVCPSTFRTYILRVDSEVKTAKEGVLIGGGLGNMIDKVRIVQHT